MRHRVTRRDFLATTAVMGASVAATGRLDAAAKQTSFKKALIGKPRRKLLEQWKAAGFDGMESNQPDASPEQAAKDRKTAESAGMKIHSVMRGWMSFNSPDADVIARDIHRVTTSLRAAEAYGADAVLVVPCKLTAKVPVPKPEEFDIEFDEKTGHVKKVVKGDNSPYEAYIREQNLATDRSRKAIERLIPVAEKTGVIIALENVWNNFWVKPKLFAHYIRSFDNPWVQCYFDIGNHVKYAMPEQWIEALGKLIVKVHVKDFTVDRSKPRGGSFVAIREGDVKWPAVMQAFKRVGYRGWLTIEGSGGLSVEEKSRRLDLIVAGK